MVRVGLALLRMQAVGNLTDPCSQPWSANCRSPTRSSANGEPARHVARGTAEPRNQDHHHPELGGLTLD
jgi:hypothetical protein